jgi:transcriptional regulator
MYIPKEFELKDQKSILEFLEQHTFGSLLVNGADGFPAVVHIPFTCEFKDSTNYLEFHVAKENTIGEELKGSNRGKMIVLGEHGYISSSVYTHVNVPTYNYQAVHASGSIQQLNQTELKSHLTKLVDQFEVERENQVRMNQWSADFIDAYLQGIVGYRIEINHLEAAFKLSQNRNEVDFNRIVADLNSGNNSEKQLAEVMKQTICPIK